MKKIIAIALSIVCVFALFACAGQTAYQKDAKDFIDAAASTKISTLNVTVVVDGSQGKLTSTYTTVYNEDSTSTMTYRIETVAGLDSAEDIAVQEGTVTCDKNGNYSDGGEISGKLGATGAKFDIGNKLIKDYEISGNSLTIKVAKDDAKEVIGVTTMSDVVIVVSKTNSNAITSVSLSYKGSDGNVAIVCVYN